MTYRILENNQDFLESDHRFVAQDVYGPVHATTPLAEEQLTQCRSLRQCKRHHPSNLAPTPPPHLRMWL
eukprot:4165333-Amphidinium_carterae.1